MKNMRARFADIVTAFIVIVVVFLLVRPGGHGVDFINTFGQSTAALVTAAADF